MQRGTALCALKWASTLSQPAVQWSAQRFVHSKSYLKRKAGHPSIRPQAKEPVFLPPTIPTTPVPQPLPSGYLPASVTASNGPSFKVLRAGVGKNLPVYRDFLSGRTKTVTVVRKIQGNIQSLADELVRVTGGARVSVHPGRVEIEGDRRDQIKTWLLGIGM